MKWLVALLVLVNIALFGYFNLFGSQPHGMQPGHEPIRPELLRIVPPEQLAVAPAVPVSATPCYEWGSFSADSLGRAQGILQNHAMAFVVRQTAPQEATRYWVYIPPRRSLRDAQAKSDELRARGVEDFFVVLEPQWRYAISLGVFKDEQLADSLLQQLQSLGVNTAVKGVRNHEGGQSSFYLGKVAESLVMELGKLKPDFPGSELKQVACQ